MNGKHLDPRPATRCWRPAFSRSSWRSGCSPRRPTPSTCREPRTSGKATARPVRAGQLLIARRLLERGVRFVQVSHGQGQPWDSHDEHRGGHRRLAGQCDRRDRRADHRPEAARAVRGHAHHLGRRVRPHAGRGIARPGQRRQERAAGTTTTTASRCGWPAAASRAGRSSGRPTSSASRRSKTPSTSTTCTRRSCTCSASTTRQFTYRYAGRDFRLTDVHGRVVKEVLA